MIDIELIDYELPLVVVEKATVIPGGFLSAISWWAAGYSRKAWNPGRKDFGGTGFPQTGRPGPESSSGSRFRFSGRGRRHHGYRSK